MLAAEQRGPLQAVLFDVAFWHLNLAYSMGSGRMLLELMVKVTKQLRTRWPLVIRRRKFPLVCEVAHTSFRSFRVIHRLREREAHAENHTKDRGRSAVARSPVASGTGGTSDRRRDDETVVACRGH